MTTIAGYRATRGDNESLTVHDVPIFLECSRGEFVADEDWIRAAFDRAEQQQAEGYFPPLHIRHHEAGQTPQRAGYFRISRVAPMTYRGRQRLALFADLVVTDWCAAIDVLEHKLPYRSVEILDPGKPEISSLALLDTEAPYLQLPMLMVSDVRDDSAPDRASVAYAAFSNPWHAESPESDAPMVVCFSTGTDPFLIAEDPEAMATKQTKTSARRGDPKTDAPKPEAANLKFEDGEDKKDDGDDGEDMQDGDSGMDIEAVCKAVESGEISVADMDKLLAAIAARKGEGEDEAEDDGAPDRLAPAMAPDAESMSQDSEDGVKFAALQAEVDALKAQAREKEAIEKRTADIDAAVARLEGRPLGADFRTECEAFHVKHGPEAFKAYVDSLAAKLGALPTEGDAAERFGVQPNALPECVQKYQAKGADAVRRATDLAQQWQQLTDAGRRLTATQAEFVAQGMRD